MNDFAKMSKELMKGNKSGELKNVINSAEGKKIGNMVD